MCFLYKTIPATKRMIRSTPTGTKMAGYIDVEGVVVFFTVEKAMMAVNIDIFDKGN